MQFIEKNSFNLRAAVYSLRKDSTSLDLPVPKWEAVGRSPQWARLFWGRRGVGVIGVHGPPLAACMTGWRSVTGFGGNDAHGVTA